MHALPKELTLSRKQIEKWDYKVTVVNVTFTSSRSSSHACSIHQTMDFVQRQWAEGVRLRAEGENLVLPPISWMSENSLREVHMYYLRLMPVLCLDFKTLENFSKTDQHREHSTENPTMYLALTFYHNDRYGSMGHSSSRCCNYFLPLNKAGCPFKLSPCITHSSTAVNDAVYSHQCVQAAVAALVTTTTTLNLPLLLCHVHHNLWKMISLKIYITF